MPRLTEKMIAAFDLPAGKREAWLSDAEVVGLRVRATVGSKTFYAAWTDRATGERQRERLGMWGGITLDQARTPARAILGEVAKGDDPKAKRAARKVAADLDRAERALTLETLVDDWAKLHLAGKRALRDRGGAGNQARLPGSPDEACHPPDTRRGGQHPRRAGEGRNGRHSRPRP
ncbi:Arm DNA-binding domain-containing protein [Falsiroseomonas sp. E2-1-a20]|uniref:Arm DNA-binding domain-containing protein n=1 Tax=Falsiroseomonas sp. E2-1-a20 TaxID=3239300 RepID=UPI003F3B0D38